MHSETHTYPIAAAVTTDCDCRTRYRRDIGTAWARVHFLGPIDWEIVLHDYYEWACRVISRKMPRRLRAGYDPEDFVADAIVDLLNKPAWFIEYGPELIVLVAKRRMIDAARSPRSRGAHLDIEVTDHQPSVALRLEALELRDFMLGRTEDPGDRAMVALRCQGHTSPEIAELSGVGVRMVQRFFKHFAEANEPY